MTKDNFIEYIGNIIVPLCEKYGIKFPSAVIAHCCNESAFGTSGLASQYYNLFGIKNSKSWKGKAVNMNTREEYTKGNLTNIVAGFRWYDSDKESVEDYLKLVTGTYYKSRCHLEQSISPQDYLNRLMPVYCTSTTQADTCGKIIKTYGLTRFDNKKVSDESKEETVSNKPTPNILTGTVTASALNVRAGAGVDNPVVTVIKKGDIVKIVDVINKSASDVWYGVILNNGKTGYCAGNYIKPN